MRKLLFLALISVPAFATEVVWLRLAADFTYKGGDVFCKCIRPGEQFYAAMEVNDDRPTRVVISNYPNIFPFTHIYKAIELTKSQVAKVALFKDIRGKYWLKSLPLSTEQVKWVLYYPSARGLYCKLPQPVATVSPATITYDFETDDIDEGILLSYSQRGIFTGTDTAGVKFEATLRIMQREYEPHD